MNFDQKWTNQNGYSLLEALASMALITIAVVGSLVVTGKRADLTSDSFDQLSLVLARNEIIGHLQRDNTWNFSIIDPTDSAFNCLRNVNSTDRSERDCTNATPIRFNVYDNRANLIFEGSNPAAGISPTGEFCTSFVDPGNNATPNPLCPIGLALTWVPVCPSGKCEDPVFEIRGQFQFNGGRRSLASDISRFDFVLQRTQVYCPPQVTPLNLIPIMGTTVGPGSVVSTTVGAAAASGLATFDNTFVSCQRTEFIFRDSLNTGSTVPLDDPNNRSRVCLASMDNPTTCIYEYLRRFDSATSTNTFDLLQAGVVVYSKPAALPFNTTTELRFRINRGLVRFCLDTECIHTFTEKTTGPARALFQPAATGFSPNGFTNILMRAL